MQTSSRKLLTFILITTGAAFLPFKGTPVPDYVKETKLRTHVLGPTTEEITAREIEDEREKLQGQLARIKDINSTIRNLSARRQEVLELIKEIQEEELQTPYAQTLLQELEDLDEEKLLHMESLIANLQVVHEM